MIELSLAQFSQATPFFDKDTPNFPVALAVIEGNNPGRIWVNTITNPSSCLVVTNGGYSFIGKKEKIEASFILDCIEILKKNKPVKLIWDGEDSHFDLFKQSGFTPIERILFYHPEIINHDLTSIDIICKRLVSPYEIKVIDAALLKKSNWLSFIKQIYGSEENFLNKGFGLGLVKGDELICEALACYIGGNAVETGSVTSEKYRGKGYATILRAFFIKECLSQNLQPVTSCQADNIASAKVSEKLGFKEEKRYYFLII